MTQIYNGFYTFTLNEEGFCAPTEPTGDLISVEEWERYKKLVDTLYSKVSVRDKNEKNRRRIESETKDFNENMLEEKEKLNKKGTVYFVEGKEGEGVKIGFTTDLKSRIRSLQTSTPHKLSLLNKIEDAFVEDEYKAHKFFSSCKLSGEWFDISEDDVEDYIFGLGVE